MKTIELSKGKVALVDDGDYNYLSQWKWHTLECKSGCWYAVRNYTDNDGKRTLMLMHRELLPVDGKLDVDHINGDGLDNRKENLRVCKHQHNMMNMKKSKSNTSGYKGVSWHIKQKKYNAYIRVEGKRISLGSFDDAKKAALAYNEAAKRFFGDFAKTNLVP